MRRQLGVLDDVPPASGAAVMGTGIVSTALLLDGAATLSRVLLVVAVVSWGVIVAAVVRRLVTDPRRLLAEARSPAALTEAAGTAVLGARVAELGWTWAAAALLGLSFVGWALLMPIDVRGIRRQTAGVAFMVTVATEGLAVLSAELALAEHQRWLLDVALAFALVGLALYPVVLVRFDLRELRTGRGDHWVAGGSLAISALALAEIARAAAALGAGGGVRSVLEDGSLAVWAAAIAWLPPLVATELRWPRPGYDIRRWATVFPVGMYAACSFGVAAAAGVHWIEDFASVWVWIAAVVWLVVFAGTLRSIVPRAIRKRPAAR